MTELFNAIMDSNFSPKVKEIISYSHGNIAEADGGEGKAYQWRGEELWLHCKVGRIRVE